MATATKKIDGFSIDSVLQIFSLEKKSQTLRVLKEDHEGHIDIDQGELIHAQYKHHEGMAAAFEVLTWEDVQIELLPLRACPKTIDKPLMSILLEVSKFKDERKSEQADGEEGPLASAVEKAELQQYKEAHQALVEYLKKHRTDPIGWVWYSRVQGNVELIKKALDMAASFADVPELVTEELKKFEVAALHLSEKVVKKCFFCWAPLNRDVTTCPCCRAHLTITAEILSRCTASASSSLDQAQERYERIVKKYPRSLSALYCLGLIHVNRNEVDKAVVFLDKATRIAPDRGVFATQLGLLRQSLEGRQAPGPSEEQALPAAEESPSHLQAVEETPARLVLVVEDSSTTRKVITMTLNRQGYRTTEAADGLEALSRISEDRPDLIMLDVILPKMDGYEILSIIKKNKEFKDIPVVMLTSKDGFINKMKGKIAGASAYLTKPFNPEKIIGEIEKFI